MNAAPACELSLADRACFQWEKFMTYPNPLPSGPSLIAFRQATRPSTTPSLPSSWTATVLLSPWGDSIAPLDHYSQLVVGAVEYGSAGPYRAMRVQLYLTQDMRFFDFYFEADADGSRWYWIDSIPDGPIVSVYGPFRTTLRPPRPTFFADNGVQWGITYPLLGSACNHWVVPAPGSSDHGSWFAFLQDGALFRVFNLDATNPLMIPILGSYYIANVPTFVPGPADGAPHGLRARVKHATTPAQGGYWNPMVTQEDIQRAMAAPLVSAPCTLQQIQEIIPGFVPLPNSVPLPAWSKQTYIEGWTIGTDLIPYYTRVCYLWTGDSHSKQQTVFIGLGVNAGQGSYLERTDSCLNSHGTDQPFYVWSSNQWLLDQCLPKIPGVGLPYPDWVSRDGGVLMGLITGNPAFGLSPGQSLKLIAAQLPRGGGELAIFWVWFTGDGDGVLFTEGNYVNPLSHNLQLIDYTLFVQNAGITQKDFSNPCGVNLLHPSGTIFGATGHATRPGSSAL
jgi:hypothetical protein